MGGTEDPQLFFIVISVCKRTRAFTSSEMLINLLLSYFINSLDRLVLEHAQKTDRMYTADKESNTI